MGAAYEKDVHRIQPHSKKSVLEFLLSSTKAEHYHDMLTGGWTPSQAL
jgi:hypothetical protein